MGPDGQKQGNNMENDGGDRHDPMSMRQLTEALGAVTDQPWSSHQNARAAAIQLRIRMILTDRKIAAIRRALQNSQLRDRLRRHRCQKPCSPQDPPKVGHLLCNCSFVDYLCIAFATSKFFEL